MISGSSRVFVILGDPVSHSLSPVMQNAAFRALGLSAVYVPLKCDADDLSAVMRTVARASGGGNVTVPHKELAARSVDCCSELAQTVEAANTFWSEDGRIIGDNTDVPGLIEALRQLEVTQVPWLIAGTGGAARAAVVAAAQQGVAVAVRSRSTQRQQQFESWVTSRGVPLAQPSECGVLINATPLGLQPGDPLPLEPDGFPRAHIAFDMVYARGETTWVKAMKSRVRRSADGRSMLVAQGAAAFERWFPGKRAPVEVMRAAVDAALR
ncbi:MAG TPA: shikimate dehydrogenase [Gemmatimonadales bacterium]|nr:shikimate dehydrogenase [Gemmatimonadales bacterium]